jgi:hypothetical protein
MGKDYYTCELCFRNIDENYICHDYQYDFSVCESCSSFSIEILENSLSKYLDKILDMNKIREIIADLKSPNVDDE